MLEPLKLEDLQLINVRTPAEFLQGYLKNAKNIDFYSPKFDLQIEALDKSIPVILYCKSGRRSAKCVSKLKLKGFKVIYDLKAVSTIGDLKEGKFTTKSIATKDLDIF
jgi:rhodanese-related sulfurtransferase